ncbi:DUF4919 domain-containing protein [Hymenobacter volaticus]|uniref:DUF4919 domain-containing protein n=1 Tax=Hymenobacter volaticus TaxID=2932254 RepID=A0ABY4G1G2_9BACT|nr:DUF4919 domain-containing protein [Hymenobacter volaticus]UOQ64653.1 DUF4919 domain-containing protein [Hymenobacter volaticus]
MTKIALLLIMLIARIFPLLGQSMDKISIPKFNDKYSSYVKQLEAGQTSIDYLDFRYSFIESEQFILASKKFKDHNKLRNQIISEMTNKEYNNVIRTAKAMLTINYTNIFAHKVLRQTYKIIGDSVNASKYYKIHFGLLNSIIKNDDGKTCSTAWPVIQLDEEYFILQMIGAKLLQQSTDTTDGLCDKMDVDTEDGEKRTYFFETSKIFEGYRKLGMK